MEYFISYFNKNFKEIPLTQGRVALVDAEDYAYLNQRKWYAWKDKTGRFYAVRKVGKHITLRMHREIMKTPKGMETDHINGDGLDNRQNNLRICTHSQNGMNSKTQSNNTSGYKGVYYYKQTRRWMACITVRSKQKHLGYFMSNEKAALAYDKASLKYFGEFARPNISISVENNMK